MILSKLTPKEISHTLRGLRLLEQQISNALDTEAQTFGSCTPKVLKEVQTAIKKIEDER